MAFTWKEDYATLINANTWDESVEGYKVTNCFGLAWNYYVAYTKFITGVDITLDMGLKCEFFMADTYKVGLAATTESYFKKTYFSSTATNICNFYTKYIASQAAVVGDDVSVRESVSESIAFRDASIGIDSIERESFSSVTTGPEVRSSGSFSHDADVLVFTAAADLSMQSAGEVSLDAPIVEIC
jgi:hypothetical protein